MTKICLTGSKSIKWRTEIQEKLMYNDNVEFVDSIDESDRFIYGITPLDYNIDKIPELLETYNDKIILLILSAEKNELSHLVSYDEIQKEEIIKTRQFFFDNSIYYCESVFGAASYIKKIAVK